MKIGFSFGRCVNDIANGTVDYNDVLVVIGRTKITDVTHIAPVIREYHYEGYMSCKMDDAVEVATRLYQDGKLHQPRVLGIHPTHVSNSDIWMDLAPTLNSTNENVQKAWRNYQMVMRLVEPEKPKPVSHLPNRKIDKSGPTILPTLDDDF